MILLLAGLLAASPDTNVAQAAHALSAGRPEQAREMIRMAVAEGASGPSVDRLLADLAFAEKRWAEASARYHALLAAGAVEPAIIEQAGIAALHEGRTGEAIALLNRAIGSPKPGWRALNARGVAADRLGDWAAADRAYGGGLAIAPESAVLLNNLGWSLLLRGRWHEAVEPLTRAAALPSADARVRANLDLARAAVEERLPRRRHGESNAAFASRLNDAGVVALRQGNKAKAAAAFARAIEASDRWFGRAANNLALAGAAK